MYRYSLERSVAASLSGSRFFQAGRYCKRANCKCHASDSTSWPETERDYASARPPKLLVSFLVVSVLK